MRARPVLASAVALAVAGSTLVPALAAVSDEQDELATGAATSSLRLLDVRVGSRSLSVLELALRSETVAGTPATSFTVTPLTADGTAYGRQSVGSRSAVVPAVDSSASAPAALSAVATARRPLVDVRSEGGTSSAGTTSLGHVSVLGLPLAAEGALSISSAVDGAGAAGGKTLRLEQLALPSLADLIAALGLNLSAVPPASLTGITSGLDLDSTSIRQAQEALERALAPVQPQVDSAEALVASADDAVEAADAQVAAAEAVLADAVAGLNDATRALSGTVTGLRIGSLVAAALPLEDTIDTVLSPSPSSSPLTEVVEDTVDAVLSPSPSSSPLTEVVEDTVDTVLSPSPVPWSRTPSTPSCRPRRHWCSTTASTARSTPFWTP